MTPEEYVNERIETQIEWHHRKAMLNKKWFMYFKAIEIVLASAVPFVIATSDTEGGEIRVVAASMSILVAIIAGLLIAFKFQEKWIQFKSVAEHLRHEKYLYLTQSGVYAKNGTLQNFVSRTEHILINEVNDWAKLVSAQDRKNKGEEMSEDPRKLDHSDDHDFDTDRDEGPSDGRS